MTTPYIYVRVSVLRPHPEVLTYRASASIFFSSRHPIYECTKNSEAGYALEAVATVGAISRHLPFHKWSAVLQKVIVQVKCNKHDEQERPRRRRGIRQRGGAGPDRSHLDVLHLQKEESGRGEGRSTDCRVAPLPPRGQRQKERRGDEETSGGGAGIQQTNRKRNVQSWI